MLKVLADLEPHVPTLEGLLNVLALMGQLVIRMQKVVELLLNVRLTKIVLLLRNASELMVFLNVEVYYK